jgi:hypothetical protein
MNYESRIKNEFFRQRRIPACRLPAGRQGRQAPLEEKVKMIVAQQKFLKEVFIKLPFRCYDAS